MHHKTIYFAISAAFILPGVFSLFVWGLKPSIDFTGGTVWEIQYSANQQSAISNQQEIEKIKVEDLEKILEVTGVEVLNIETKPEEHFIMRLKPIDNVKKEELTLALSENFKDFTELRYELVGPTLGRELLTKTITGLILAAALILFYTAYRFKEKMYGVCAILAMFHDTIILLGGFSLLGHFFAVEIDTLTVTAVLTVLSFSVHDTIVVYDRIRESIKKNPAADFTELINKAVNETLTRSINNSLTIIFMLLALALLGGITIRWFVVALLIGTITGTYSSTFTAAPLLVVFHNLTKKHSK